MESKNNLLLKVLLNRAHGKITSNLISALSPQEAQMILEETIPYQDPLPLFYFPQQALDFMHYSWLIQLINSQPTTWQKGLINCLSPDFQKKICSLKNLSIPEIEPPFLVKKFYLDLFYRLIEKQVVLPLNYLPESSFNPLLKWKKSELVAMIDLLGLYDLSQEIKQIVSPKVLKSLYHCFSAKEGRFLRQCLHQKDKINTPKLNLDKYLDNCKNLKKELHLRGLKRLSIALSTQDKNFLWYLTRILDSGRGNLLLQLIKPTTAPVVAAVSLQVLNAMNFFKTG